MDPILAILIILATSYLLGSVPFGLVLVKIAGLGDIRQRGSGNIGATNVLRTGKKGIAALTLLLDMLKGAAALYMVAPLAYLLNGSQPVTYPLYLIYLCGIMVLLGHLFPFWLRFKGGKGVATYFGILLILNPAVFLIAALNWIGVFLTQRISSLASLFALGFAPFFMWILEGQEAGLFCMFYSLMVTYKHHGNIKRLIQGTESSFRGGKSA